MSDEQNDDYNASSEADVDPAYPPVDEQEHSQDTDVPYGDDVHPNGPSTRDQRFNKAFLGGTFDPEGSANTTDDINAANAQGSRLADELDRKPPEDSEEKDEVKKRLQKLRDKRIRKTSLAKELCKMPPSKGDAENGLEIGKAAWQGMLHGFFGARQDQKDRHDAKLAAEEAELREAVKAFDKEERDQKNNRDKSEDNAAKRGETKFEAASEPKSENGPDVKNGPDGASGNGSAKIDPKGMGPSGGAAATTPASAPTMDGAKVTGDALLGLAASAANPALGAGLAAKLAHGTQSKAGMTHANDAKAPIVPGGRPATAADVAQTMNARRELGVVPAARPDGPNHNRLDHPAPIPANGNNPRAGGLFAQARGLPRPSAPTLSIGPTSTTARPRVVGMGAGITGLMKALRSMSGNDNELSVASWVKKQRDSEGMSR